jgi:hypothetical protein
MQNVLPRTRPSGAAGARAAAALLALGLPGVAVLGVAVAGAATPRAVFAADGEEPLTPAPMPAPAGEAPAPAPMPQEGEEPPGPHEPSPDPVGPVAPPEVPPAPEAEEPVEVTPPKDDASAAGAKKPGSKDDPRAGFAGGNSLGKYLGTWADGLYASGGASLSSRNYSVAGSEQAREAYDQQFNFQGFGRSASGPFQQNMDLTLQGKVFNMFNINARLTNSRQGNYFNQIFGFNYDAKGTNSTSATSPRRSRATSSSRSAAPCAACSSAATSATG